MNWTDLFSQFTYQPLKALGQFFDVISTNFAENWWRVLITIALFWTARAIVFGIINAVVPRNLNDATPKWARSRAMRAWRTHLYRESLEKRSVQRSRAIVALTKSMVDPIMGFVAFLTVFGLLGMTMTVATGSIVIGALSLAVGLGAQGIIKDIIGGITVLATDSFGVGDYIDMQFGVSGVVKNIGLRLTTLEANDGTMWFVRHSEIPKVGNLTAAKATVVTDVTLTWNEDDKRIRTEDLQFAEKLLDSTVKDLAEALDKVDKVAREHSYPSKSPSKYPKANGKNGNSNYSEDLLLNSGINQIASVLPDLIPSMGADTLYMMRAIKDDDTRESLNIDSTVQRISGNVPIFTRVETLGLINSTVNTVTLRLRISLPVNSSRTQAMSVLRRAVFEAFITQDISSSFSDVPHSELPALGLYEREDSLSAIK